MVPGRGAELLRPATSSGRASFLELFFDLAFVFALTRVSQRFAEVGGDTGGDHAALAGRCAGPRRAPPAAVGCRARRGLPRLGSGLAAAVARSCGPLTCGKTAYGHDGDSLGASAWTFTTGDRHAVTLSATWGTNRPAKSAVSTCWTTCSASCERWSVGAPARPRCPAPLPEAGTPDTRPARRPDGDRPIWTWRPATAGAPCGRTPGCPRPAGSGPAATRSALRGGTATSA